jgi:hypothetical protein
VNVRFDIGDEVRWVQATPASKARGMSGVILDVIPSISRLDELTMYEIQFQFGTFRLYGTQIEPVPQSKLKSILRMHQTPH